MADKADESPAEEVVENQEVQEETEQVAELDQFIEVEGDLVENPAIEEETEDEEVDNAGDTDETADGGDSQDAGGGDAVNEVEAEAEAEEADESADQAQEPVDEPLADPGDFTPKNDYSFEVTTTDGKTVKISTPAEAEKFAERLDSEEGLVSASQFAKFARAAAKMDIGLEQEKAQFEAQKVAYEEQQQAQEKRAEQVQNWSNELRYLEAKGLLPKISKSEDADWLGNADSEAVKARMEIFKWMDTENEARTQAGISPVTSAVDALRMMQAEQAEQAAKDTKTQEGDARRAKGAMVGKNAPYRPDNTPKNSIVGLGGSLQDLVYEAQQEIYG